MTPGKSYWQLQTAEKLVALLSMSGRSGMLFRGLKAIEKGRVDENNASGREGTAPCRPSPKLENREAAVGRGSIIIRDAGVPLMSQPPHDEVHSLK